ncbi:hypothetical protein ACH4RG_23330 [Streptomyces sp. NPDC021019]|uniref:hypothetical protein n=1 Tax=Streptomyces sp. NPDC021019 TaxID=3365108 RepID=UPI00379F495F
MIQPTAVTLDALRITPTGGGEPLLLTPFPVSLGLQGRLSEDGFTVERYDLTLSVSVAPEHVGHDTLSEALVPLVRPLREIAEGGPFQIETWTAVPEPVQEATAVPSWLKTTLRYVDQVDTETLDVALVQPDDSDMTDATEPYARVTFLRAIVRPGEEADSRLFYRMQFGADDLAPPPVPAPAGADA